MRLLVPTSLCAATVVVSCVGGAAQGKTPRPAASSDRAAAAGLRRQIDHYRRLAWTYERAAHLRSTPTSFLERRVVRAGRLRRLLVGWERDADVARRRALASLHHRFLVPVPKAVGLRAPVARRIRYNRRLASSLLHWTSGGAVPTRGLLAAGDALEHWQTAAARAAVRLSVRGPTRLVVVDWLTRAFLCIHRYEGAWDANTGNGYYGGLQMDRGFQTTYGPEFVRHWGTADRWPAWAQVVAARRAFASGRRFGPWPNTSRMCGLY